MIEVKENFLKQDVFDLIKNKINSTEFSWFYQHEQVKQDGFFFSHSLYNHDLSNSMFYEFIITPFKNKIKLLSRIMIQQSGFFQRSPYLRWSYVGLVHPLS